MVTAQKTENETTAAVAETTATPAVVVAPAPSVDISNVPETPAELLKQWEPPASRRPLIHTVIYATMVRLWDAVAGPPMTNRQRVNREIAEHRGFAETLHRNV